MAQAASRPDDDRPDEAYDIRIAADGQWWHEGAPIGRAALVKLFATVLRRDAAGEYWLITPAERGRITVEDAPFIAVEVMQTDGEIRFRTNVEDWATLDPDHPLRVEARRDGPRVYVTVRPGLEAKLARSVYYHLVEMAVTRGDQIGVESVGAFFPLGPVE